MDFVEKLNKKKIWFIKKKSFFKYSKNKWNISVYFPAVGFIRVIKLESVNISVTDQRQMDYLGQGEERGGGVQGGHSDGSPSSFSI